MSKRKIHIKAGNHMFKVKLLCKRKVNDKTNYVSLGTLINDKSLICKNCLRVEKSWIK
jgi:hypothetical protein